MRAWTNRASTLTRLLGFSLVTLGLLPTVATAAVNLARLVTGEATGRLEWRLDGLPMAANPFDPDVIAVDAVFTEPDGRQRRVPAFWYQDFRRELHGGSEVLTRIGPGEWRLRFAPTRTGDHQVTLTVSTNRTPPLELLTTSFPVDSDRLAAREFAAIAPDQRYFTTADGRPLPLVGADTCWHGSRGTYDYDDWFPAMAAAGWNWGRLWMAPWAFGIETAPDERLQYRLDRAWQLDRVMDLAASHGLRLLLCLDYHGMFETEPDFWGGNNNWPRHPYNATQGGPCTDQRAFFTHPDAHRLYQKRLRYLIARYSASPALFAWQFFNEIDNVYRHLNAAEVAAWHAQMGPWLKTHDPWTHPVTTSLTGGSDRPDIWTLPALDFAVYHSYSEPSPARRLAEVVDSMRRRYAKPVLIGEAGVDWRGWARDSDPFLRGFRQLLWGGITSGSAGTSMSWWWESIHSQNVYPAYRALTNILAESTWGSGSWEVLHFARHPEAPTRVGELLEGGQPFDATLQLDGSWGAKPAGQLALADPHSASLSPQRLNAFVHGTAHPDLRTPFILDAWWADDARLVLHLNSVSDGAILTVRVDGRESFRRVLPNKDGSWQVNNEYDEDIPVGLPAGHHRVEIRNAGGDWFYLDRVQAHGVLPAAYENNWSPAPTATGIGREGEMLVYLVAPGVEYPAQATVADLKPAPAPSIVVSNIVQGEHTMHWYRPADGTRLGVSKGRTGDDGRLILTPPPFAEDLVGHIFLSPRLRAAGFTLDHAFAIEVEGLRGSDFELASGDLQGEWSEVTEAEWIPGPPGRWIDPHAAESARRFYRLQSRPPP